MTERFGLGSLGLGGLPGVMESMEMVRKAWSSLSMPAGMTPPMSIDELDRRIADLKAVEQWLDMNLSMLRGTIQALEIQRGTLSALGALGRAASEGGATAEALARAAAALAQSTRKTAAGGNAKAPTAAQAKPGAGGAPDPTADDASGLAAGITKAATAAMNPAAWWDMLQGQFNQVAQAALSGHGLEIAKAVAREAAGTKKPRSPKGAAPKAAGKRTAGKKRGGATPA